MTVGGLNVNASVSVGKKREAISFAKWMAFEEEGGGLFECTESLNVD